jgi:hypothetical protein
VNRDRRYMDTAPSDLGRASVRETAVAIFAYLAFYCSAFFLMVAWPWRGGGTWFALSLEAFLVGTVVVRRAGRDRMYRVRLRWLASHAVAAVLFPLLLVLTDLHQLGLLILFLILGYPFAALLLLAIVIPPYKRVGPNRTDKAVASLITLLFVAGALTADKTRFDVFSAGIRLRLLLVGSQLRAEANRALARPQPNQPEYDIKYHEAFVIYPRDENGNGSVGWRESSRILSSAGIVFDTRDRVERRPTYGMTEHIPRISPCSQIEGPWYWCGMD